MKAHTLAKLPTDFIMQKRMVVVGGDVFFCEHGYLSQIGGR